MKPPKCPICGKDTTLDESTSNDTIHDFARMHLNCALGGNNEEEKDAIRLQDNGEDLESESEGNDSG